MSRTCVLTFGTRWRFVCTCTFRFILRRPFDSGRVDWYAVWKRWEGESPATGANQTLDVQEKSCNRLNPRVPLMPHV